MIKNWIILKLYKGRPIHYPEIFHYLDKEFDINPQTQEKFAEIVRRIYNSIFVSLCKVSLKRTNRPRKNSHWIKDLNIHDQKDLSSYYCKMKKVPFSPKRVNLSNHHDEIDDYGLKEKEEYIAYDITKQVEKANNNKKKKEKVNTTK